MENMQLRFCRVSNPLFRITSHFEQDKQLLDSTLIAKEHLEKELAEVKKELKQKSLEFSAKSETTISKLEEQLQQTKLELEVRTEEMTVMGSKRGFDETIAFVWFKIIVVGFFFSFFLFLLMWTGCVLMS